MKKTAFVIALMLGCGCAADEPTACEDAYALWCDVTTMCGMPSGQQQCMPDFVAMECGYMACDDRPAWRLMCYDIISRMTCDEIITRSIDYRGLLPCRDDIACMYGE